MGSWVHNAITYIMFWRYSRNYYELWGAPTVLVTWSVSLTSHNRHLWFSELWGSCCEFRRCHCRSVWNAMLFLTVQYRIWPRFVTINRLDTLRLFARLKYRRLSTSRSVVYILPLYTNSSIIHNMAGHVDKGLQHACAFLFMRCQFLDRYTMEQIATYEEKQPRQHIPQFFV